MDALLRVHFITGFLLLLCLPGFSQQEKQKTGVITGSVVNRATREPLPAANVTVVGTALGASTGADGSFTIVDVPPGEYAVRVFQLGFDPRTLTDVVVSPVRPAQVVVGLDESIIEVGGVETGAGYFTSSPDLPVSTRLQSNEEIRRLPGGFEDVLRAVSILPGVARVDGGRNDIIARGGAPSENLYIVDGVEIPNINHFGTQGSAGGPLSFINLDFVSSTLFSTGGFGPRYGDRLSSVLQIDLRDGRSDRLGGKLSISASQFGLNLEGPTGSEGSFLFSVRRSYLDFIFKSAGFGFVPEYWDVTTGWRYRLGPSDNLKVVAIAALDNVNFFNDTEEQVYDNSKILGSDQKQVSGGATWQHLFSSGYASLTLAQSYTGFRYGQRDTLQNPVFVNNSIESESSLRADVLLKPAASMEISLGVQGRRVRFSNDIFLPAFVTPFGDSLGVDLRNDTAAAKAGAYVQLSNRFRSLTLNAGIRWNYFSMLSGASALDPRFSASLSLSSELTITASAGRYSQSPSYVWLVSYPENRRLNFLTADQYIIGVDVGLRTDTRLTLEGYLKKYRDYPASEVQDFLVLSNTGAGFGGSEESFSSFGLEPLVSAGKGTSMGVELSIRKKMSEIPCYGLVAVSVSRTRFTALDGIERPSSFDQRLVLNLGGGYYFNEKWEVSSRFRLATGRPYTPFLPDGMKDVAAYNGSRLASNHSLDIRVDRRWFFDRWTLIAYIDIQNIYNKKPSQLPRFNERTGMVEEDDSIGLLPTIGISAEF
jgi:hypothetical protein